MTSTENADRPKVLEPTLSLLLFLFGFGLFMFTRRSELVPTVPTMIAVAPIFILRFSRNLPAVRAIFLTFFGFILSMNIALWGLFELSDLRTGLAFNLIRSTLLAALYTMPFAIDRLLYARFGSSIWSVLSFPVAVTAMMYLSSIEGPFDGTSAKAIYGHGTIEMMQLYALTGLWGFIFLWSLPASLINHIWERRFSARIAAYVLASFAIILTGIYGYGAYRLVSVENPDTLKIASVVLLPEDGKPVSMEPFFSSKKILPYDETLSRIESLTARAVASGAQIVSFQEHLLTVMEPDIQRVRADYQRIARENAVWLSITYSWYSESEDSKGNNMHLLIDDQGQVRGDYEKRFLLGFGAAGETRVFNKGAEIIQTVDTPYGRVAISICRDMSFPAFARQAGRAGADIMFTPSYDFPKSTSTSDSGRAIENGFTLVRPTYNGNNICNGSLRPHPGSGGQCRRRLWYSVR